MGGYKKHWIKSFTGQTILDAMPEVAYVFNKDQEMLMWNKNTEKVLGYTADELYRKKVSEFVEPELLELNEEAFGKLFSTHEQQIITQNILTKTGEKIPVVDAANYAIIDGEEYLIGMAIDISDLRATEEKLRKTIIELQKLKEKLREENLYLKEEYQNQYDFETIIGSSELTIAAVQKVEHVAPTQAPVLFTGEIGTRKELFARVLHKKSQRSNQPYFMVDCSKSSEEFVESKLFGEEYSAPKKRPLNRMGKLELAHNGTLFLYEIGELSMSLQSKIFRVLKEGTFESIGSTKTKKVDVRIVASTRHNLIELIKKGQFREDLYYLLNVYPIHVSPLRNRLEDIPLLANYFLEFYNKKLGKSVVKISQKTLKSFRRYSWPGNVNELENVIERAVIVSNGTLLQVGELIDPRNQPQQLGLVSLEEYERNYIIHVLEKTQWRVEGKKGAAVILQMNPETLRSRMRKLEIKRP